MSLQINYNGKTYNSLEEMPPEVRAAYQQAMALLADQNGNGMPDFLDGLMQGQSLDALVKPLNVLASTHTQIVFNGQTYTSVDQMPPEARRAYEQAMGAVDQNRNGVPDALEQGGIQTGQPMVNVTTLSAAGSAPRPAPFASPYTPAGVEPDHPAARAGRLRTALFVVLGLAVVVLLAALALVALFVLPNLRGG